MTTGELILSGIVMIIIATIVIVRMVLKSRGDTDLTLNSRRGELSIKKRNGKNGRNL